MNSTDMKNTVEEGGRSEDERMSFENKNDSNKKLNFSEKLSKEEKKKLKEKKKEEKLAKLAAKQLSLKEREKNSKPKALVKVKKEGGYNSEKVESKWVNYWKTNKVFHADDNSDKESFSMIIPPPNITGSLHIGHAMMIAIEDTIARYHRLNGKNVLYLPGMDHAGIATQAVVLKQMARENIKVTRDVFMSKAHEWSEKYGNRILEQFDRMGTSLDYSKKAFTLDEASSNAVTKAFITLYERGLIYRGNKIINWSGSLKTTLSDLEVNYKEVKGGTLLKVDGGEYKFGMMYYVKYYFLFFISIFS